MKKTTAPHELWQTCLYWMTATGNPVNKKYCRQQLTTHPDYPALTAVVDFLEEGNMRYTAAQADASYIHEMNYPLLAHIKVPGNEYMHIISKAADWDVQKDITRHWSGVVLFAETDSHWQNAENEKYNRQQKANKVYLAAVFTALATLFIFTIAKIPAFSFALFGLLSLAGLLLSILITGSELGVQNNLVKQVCGAVSKSGCDAVLKTKFAKGFAGLTTGDYATLYFSSQFIAYIGSSFYLTLYTSLLWIALPGIVVAAASIYTQAMLIKQWCALCLALVSVLLLQFAIAVYALPNTGALISWHSLATFAGITMLLYLVLLPIKKILKTNHTQEQQVAELKKWKMDVGLFISQWQSEQQIDEKLWQNELIFGKIDAPLRIIVACNPYCGPCASEHLHLEQILERYPDKVSLAIRFL